jgi:FKBP-type peptidyl-prolyl cis-trans isomerase 2
MLKVEDSKVVTFEYTLKNDNGDVLDSSANHAPLAIFMVQEQLFQDLRQNWKAKKLEISFML